MKKLGLMLLLAVAMVFVSCKDETGDVFTMIPADVNYAAAIDGGGIIKKAGIKIENGEVVFPDSYKSLFDKALSAKDREEMAAIADAGIDFDRKMYFFGTNDYEGVLIVPISDSDAFKAFWEKNADADMVSDGELYKMSDGNDIAYLSAHHLVYASPAPSVEESTAEAYLKELITNGFKASIKDNADAMEMLDSNADMSFYGNYGKILEISGGKTAITAMYGEAFSEYINSIRGMGGTLSFNKQDIDITFKGFIDENDVTKQYEAVLGDPSADGLKFIPADMQLVFSGSIKGEELMKIDVFNTLLDNVKDNPYITKEELKEYIAGIDGPLTIGGNYTNYIINRASIPQIYGALKTSKADEMCGKLQAGINGLGLIACTKVGDEYVVNISNECAVAFGSKDGFFYFRTSGPKVTESMYDDDFARGIFESVPGAAYMNLRKGSSANTVLKSMLPGLQFSAYLKGETIDNRTSSIKLVVEEPEGNNVIETLLSIVANSGI